MNEFEIKNYLEKYCRENPDRLSNNEKKALSDYYNKPDEEIKKELCSLILIAKDKYSELKNKSDNEIIEWLFLEFKKWGESLNSDFVDWFELQKTFNVYMRDFIIREYPLGDRYRKVLCVGDGEKCHLGRKLAMQGYRVVSVDPLAQKEFICSNIRTVNNSDKGSIYVVKRPFTKESIDMINWADIIVGSKVPMLAEILLEMPKPVIFNVSLNSEIHNISFGGKPVESGKDLQQWISASKGVHTFEMDPESTWNSGYGQLIFVKDLERDKERAEEEAGFTRQ